MSGAQTTMGPRPQGEKLGAAVARRIESEIIDLGWPTGRVLGSEADLIARYGVSRAVLREAVRLLEHRQVAGMRRGPGGGLIVRSPAVSAAVEVLATYLDFVGVTAEELHQARAILETLAARLAATRIDEDGAVKLMAHVEAETARNTEVAAGFHIVVAERSGNAALALFVRSLIAVIGRRIVRSELAPAKLRESDEAHVDLAAAIIDGKPVVAQRLMTDHLDATSWLERMAVRNARRDPSPARAVGTDRRDWQASKLPERTAYRIRNEIAAKGWPVGETLGSEADFLDRYAVSRAALREAVRILEYYGVAEMRRGPGGGLVVGEPRLDRVVSTVVLYLEHLHLDADRLHEVRTVIDSAVCELAAARHTEADEERLRAVVATEAEHGTMPEADSDHDLHLALAEVGGNRALSVFAHVLARMTTHHTVPPSSLSKAQVESINTEVARAHGRILDAVLGGDPATASRRMARHLDALRPFVSDRRQR